MLPNPQTGLRVKIEEVYIYTFVYMLGCYIALMDLICLYVLFLLFQNNKEYEYFLML